MNQLPTIHDRRAKLSIDFFEEKNKITLATVFLDVGLTLIVRFPELQVLYICAYSEGTVNTEDMRTFYRHLIRIYQETSRLHLFDMDTLELPA